MTFIELLTGLTKEQRDQLAAAGIPSPRISEWKAGKYIPGRTHTLALCRVTGADFDQINRELTVLEAERDTERNPLFAGFTQGLRSAWHFS
ncbi:helix-turn-helix domain-containing protein [Variovorax sp. GB1P17]|uniref:helix-turn-helix domain-containing protein n=1 Tax=Variovorax sp. GB1P17 TaxID=3443740 RepID=UPI003F458C48